MEYSPTNTLDIVSSEPSNIELELRVWFAFRTAQDSLDSSVMRISTVSSISCR